MKQYAVLTLVVLMFIFAMGISWAAGPGYGRHDNDTPCDGPGWGHRDPGQGLNLTEAQRGEIMTLRTAEHEKLAPLREKLDESREAMRQAWQNDPVDEARLRELARTHADLKVEMQLAKRQFQQQLEAILTPEQLAMRAEHRQQRSERRDEHRGAEGMGHRHGNFYGPQAD